MALIHEAETGAILGACIEVHRELGHGFLESVYDEALQQEFQHRQIPYVSQQPVSVLYKGQVLTAKFIPDFICFELVLLEIKAVEALHRSHLALVLNYLQATRFRVALLVNFGSDQRLEYKRVVI